MLELTGVSKTYRRRGGAEVQALRDVSLKVMPGDLAAVQGPSGCGKSTLLLIAGGLLHPDCGRVLLDGEPVYDLSADGRARLRGSSIGFVFQQFHLVPYLTVLENVKAPSLACSGNDDVGPRARQLLERFALGERRDHLPEELSTGERQRTALARALVNSPRLLLADEPTGNLDPDNAEIVLSALEDFAAGGGAVMIVSHDKALCARRYNVRRMLSGAIVEHTTQCAEPGR